MSERDEPSVAADWWYTVDRALLVAFLVLVATGVVLSLAASPGVAMKRGLPTYFFVERHLLFAVMASVLLVAMSWLSPMRVRRLALGILLLSMAAMAAVLVIGPEINGARRWLRLGGHSLQPSEFAKPAFVVISAWLLAERQRRRDVPATPFAVALLVGVELLLVLQPDIGQATLIGAVWGVMFLLAGGSLVVVASFAGAGAVGGFGSYIAFPHVRGRIDRFFVPGNGDTFQTDRALQSFVEGGFLGRGPGEGTIKHVLPDAHTDFIFAVVAEEYGVLACLGLVAIFAGIVLRAVAIAIDERDPFTRLAAAGLALLIGFQAMINMGVNIGLLPAKGMTLPFISNGGSSLLALGASAGMLLALTRARRDPKRARRPEFAASVMPGAPLREQGTTLS